MRPGVRSTRSSALVALVATLVCGAPAFASAPASARPRPLAVSVPSDPAAVAAGGSSTLQVRVSNPGSEAVRVTMSSRGLLFGDNGRIKMSTRPDPEWAGRVSFPAHPFDVAAQASTVMDLRIQVPRDLAPDLYFIGFVVTPVDTAGGGLHYVNQIASYLTVDVPGPRIRKLAARLLAPGVSFSGRAQGTVTIDNVGRANAVYWGEFDTSATPGHGSPTQGRFDRSLLPKARVRSFSVTGRSNWPISFVTMHVHVVYPSTTDAATAQIDLSRRVLVVEPIPALLLVASVAGLTGVAVRRRRRTRATRQRHRSARTRRRRGRSR